MNLEPVVIAVAVARRTVYSRTRDHEIRAFAHVNGAHQLPNPDRLYVEATALIAGDGTLTLQRWEDGEWSAAVCVGFLQDHPGIAPLDVNAWVPLDETGRLDMRVLIDGNWQGGSKLRISYDQPAHPLIPDI